MRAKLNSVYTSRPGREQGGQTLPTRTQCPSFSLLSLYLLVFVSIVAAVNTSLTWRLTWRGEGRGKGLLGSCNILGQFQEMANFHVQK